MRRLEQSIIETQSMPVKQYWWIFSLVIITLLAAYLRFTAILETVIDHPIRADAREYVLYAYNLEHSGIYSRSEPSEGNKQELIPDAMRPPGYPLFIKWLMEPASLGKTVSNILFAQALLGVVMTLLSFLLFRSIMPMWWALAATMMVALSPHMVSMTTYVLTETLFSFLLVFGFVLLINARNSRATRVMAFLAGSAFAYAALTRPSLQYFIVPLAVLMAVHFRRSGGVTRAVALLLGFALVFLPWIVRNVHTIGKPSDDTLMIATLHHGSYPGFLYQDRPETFGFPYRFDPRTSEIGKDMNSVLSEIKRRFLEEPGKHLYWYLIGKPITFLSWNIIAGMGDVFVYPVTKSPYFDNPIFRYTHLLMQVLHWPLVILAMVACVWVWLPSASVRLGAESIFIWRAMALFLAYFVALHMIGAPFPRYSIPLRPLLFGFSVLSLYLISKEAVQRRLRISMLDKENCNPPI